MIIIYLEEALKVSGGLKICESGIIFVRLISFDLITEVMASKKKAFIVQKYLIINFFNYNF